MLWKCYQPWCDTIWNVATGQRLTSPELLICQTLGIHNLYAIANYHQLCEILWLKSWKLLKSWRPRSSKLISSKATSSKNHITSIFLLPFILFLYNIDIYIFALTSILEQIALEQMEFEFLGPCPSNTCKFCWMSIEIGKTWLSSVDFPGRFEAYTYQTITHL